MRVTVQMGRGQARQQGEFLRVVETDEGAMYEVRIAGKTRLVSPSDVGPGEREGKPRRDNPEGRLTDGRKVWWQYEIKEGDQNTLSELLGVPVVWIGFVKKDDPMYPGGYVQLDPLTMDRTKPVKWLGKSTQEVIQNSGLAVKERNADVFDGTLGDYLVEHPYILASLREELHKNRIENPMMDERQLLARLDEDRESLGYESKEELRRDLLDLVRTLPSGYAAAPALHHYQLGAKTEIIYPTTSGVEAAPARYVLLESDELVPSHLPLRQGIGAEENPLYPPNLQERDYAADVQESDKVRRNATGFVPGLVVNDNPDAINGPPIIDENGLVLGGNSRAMTIKLLYQMGLGDALIQTYEKKAWLFGFTTDDIFKYREPVIARMIDIDARNDREMGRLWVRRFNVSLTQAMSPAQSLTATAKGLTRQNWQEISEIMARDMSAEDTLFSYLGSGRSLELLRYFASNNVIPERVRSAYFDDNRLNRYGKRFVQDLLVGHLFAFKPGLLADMNDTEFNVFGTIAPYVIVAGCCDPAWDIRDDLIIGWHAASLAWRTGRTLEDAMTPPSVGFGGRSLFEAAGVVEEAEIPFVQARETIRRRFFFALMYLHGKSGRYLRKGFARYANKAKYQSGAQGTLDLGPYGKISSFEGLMWAFDARYTFFQDGADSWGAEFDFPSYDQIRQLPTDGTEKPSREMQLYFDIVRLAEAWHRDAQAQASSRELEERRVEINKLQRQILGDGPQSMGLFGVEAPRLENPPRRPAAGQTGFVFAPSPPTVAPAIPKQDPLPLPGRNEPPAPRFLTSAGDPYSNCPEIRSLDSLNWRGIPRAIRMWFIADLAERAARYYAQIWGKPVDFRIREGIEAARRFGLGEMNKATLEMIRSQLNRYLQRIHLDSNRTYPDKNLEKTVGDIIFNGIRGTGGVSGPPFSSYDNLIIYAATGGPELNQRAKEALESENAYKLAYLRYLCELWQLAGERGLLMLEAGEPLLDPPLPPPLGEQSTRQSNPSSKPFVPYPWSECIKDQTARYGSEKIAARVCGSIRDRSRRFDEDRHSNPGLASYLRQQRGPSVIHEALTEDAQRRKLGEVVQYVPGVGFCLRDQYNQHFKIGLSEDEAAARLRQLQAEHLDFQEYLRVRQLNPPAPLQRWENPRAHGFTLPENKGRKAYIEGSFDIEANRWTSTTRTPYELDLMTPLAADAQHAGRLYRAASLLRMAQGNLSRAIFKAALAQLGKHRDAGVMSPAEYTAFLDSIMPGVPALDVPSPLALTPAEEAKKVAQADQAYKEVDRARHLRDMGLITGEQFADLEGLANTVANLANGQASYDSTVDGVTAMVDEWVTLAAQKGSARESLTGQERVTVAAPVVLEDIYQTGDFAAWDIGALWAFVQALNEEIESDPALFTGRDRRAVGEHWDSVYFQVEEAAEEHKKASTKPLMSELNIAVGEFVNSYDLPEDGAYREVWQRVVTLQAPGSISAKVSPKKKSPTPPLAPPPDLAPLVAGTPPTGSKKIPKKPTIFQRNLYKVKRFIDLSRYIAQVIEDHPHLYDFPNCCAPQLRELFPQFKVETGQSDKFNRFVQLTWKEQNRFGGKDYTFSWSGYAPKVREAVKDLQTTAQKWGARGAKQLLGNIEADTPADVHSLSFVLEKEEKPASKKRSKKQKKADRALAETMKIIIKRKDQENRKFPLRTNRVGQNTSEYTKERFSSSSIARNLEHGPASEADRGYAETFIDRNKAYLEGSRMWSEKPEYSVKVYQDGKYLESLGTFWELKDALALAPEYTTSGPGYEQRVYRGRELIDTTPLPFQSPTEAPSKKARIAELAEALAPEIEVVDLTYPVEETNLSLTPQIPESKTVRVGGEEHLVTAPRMIMFLDAGGDVEQNGRWVNYRYMNWIRQQLRAYLEDTGQRLTGHKKTDDLVHAGFEDWLARQVYGPASTPIQEQTLTTEQLDELEEEAHSLAHAPTIALAEDAIKEFKLTKKQIEFLKSAKEGEPQTGDNSQQVRRLADKGLVRQEGFTVPLKFTWLAPGEVVRRLLLEQEKEDAARAAFLKKCPYPPLANEKRKKYTKAQWKKIGKFTPKDYPYAELSKAGEKLADLLKAENIAVGPFGASLIRFEGVERIVQGSNGTLELAVERGAARTPELWCKEHETLLANLESFAEGIAILSQRGVYKGDDCQAIIDRIRPAAETKASHIAEILAKSIVRNQFGYYLAGDFEAMQLLRGELTCADLAAKEAAEDAKRQANAKKRFAELTETGLELYTYISEIVFKGNKLTLGNITRALKGTDYKAERDDARSDQIVIRSPRRQPFFGPRAMGSPELAAPSLIWMLSILNYDVNHRDTAYTDTKGWQKLREISYGLAKGAQDIGSYPKVRGKGKGRYVAPYETSSEDIRKTKEHLQEQRAELEEQRRDTKEMLDIFRKAREKKEKESNPAAEARKMDFPSVTPAQRQALIDTYRNVDEGVDPRTLAALKKKGLFDKRSHGPDLTKAGAAMVEEVLIPRRRAPLPSDEVAPYEVGLQTKAQASGIPYDTLLAVFKRGVYAGEKIVEAGSIPGIHPYQWAFDRVDKFIKRQGTFYKADRDLAEEAGLLPESRADLEYPFLQLKDIRPLVPMMEELGLSEKARSNEGFLFAYENAKGQYARLQELAVLADEAPDYWYKKRRSFNARATGAIKAKNEPLWVASELEGLTERPSNRHLNLIAWAYSPDPEALRDYIEQNKAALRRVKK